jgi:hypothetical protein
LARYDPRSLCSLSLSLSLHAGSISPSPRKKTSVIGTPAESDLLFKAKIGQ